MESNKILRVEKSSLIDVNSDVIVMSANPSLLAGSGISGHIHKAAGPELEKAAKPLAPLDVGNSIITPAFNLSAKYVVHTVCPRFLRGSDDEIRLLSSAYESALNSFNELDDVKSIAFVSMGTGVYRWPIELAAQIAINELVKSEYEDTIMCVIDEKTKSVYKEILDNVK
jgi:O-acetyl-ADP-ribose deacetylase